MDLWYDFSLGLATLELGDSKDHCCTDVNCKLASLRAFTFSLVVNGESCGPFCPGLFFLLLSFSGGGSTTFGGLSRSLSWCLIEIGI